MSYRKKNIILIIGVLVLFWLSWNLALVETIELEEKVSHMELELESIKNAPEEINRLKMEIDKVNHQSEKLHLSIMEMRKNLLLQVSTLADKYSLSLNSFPDYYVQSVENIELTTSPVVLSGEFKGMIQLIYDFEKNTKVGKISSASFEIKVSPRTKKRTLSLTLYVQSINL